MSSIACFYAVVLTYCLYQISFSGTLAAPAPDIMSSVCGTNGTTHMLFAHEQDIIDQNKHAVDEHTVFKLSPLGCCLLQHRDASSCAAETTPICAIDIDSNVRRVFNNSCIMDETACKQNVDWRFLQNGMCNEIGLDPIPCTKVFEPVCAIFAGVKSTFSSECLVNSENLRTGADWRILSENICTEDLIHHIPRVPRKTSLEESSNDKNTSTELYLADEQTDNVEYIHTEPQFETEIISDASPSMIESLLGKGMSLNNIVSITTPNFDTQHDDTIYLEETLQHPTDDLDHSWATYPDGSFSSEFVETQTLSSISMDPVVISEEEPATNTSSQPTCIYGTAPICGISQHNKTLTFANFCEMVLKNKAENNTWSVLHSGECGECDFACKDEPYKPICVLYKGMSYTLANYCYMKKNICLTGTQEWELSNEGECHQKIEIKAETNNATTSVDSKDVGTTI